MGRRISGVAALALAAGCLAAPDHGTDGAGGTDAGRPEPDGTSPADGLIGWYTMDRFGDGGMVVPDETGGGNGVCIASTCPLLAAGHLGDAYEFDGSDDEVNIADRASLHTESGTVAAWVQTSLAPAAVMSKPYGEETTNSWLLFIQGDGSVLFETTGGLTYTDVDQFSFGDWTHLAMTWTPTESAVFIDGVRIESGPGDTAFDENPVVLGGDHDYGALTVPMLGLLDDVRIYNRALDEEEIGELAAM